MIVECISSGQHAELLAEADPNSRNDLLETLPAEVIATALDGMPPDDAADLLAEIRPERQTSLLAALDPEEAVEIRRQPK